MITRSLARRLPVAVLLALAAGLAAPACDKVPLLAPTGSTISVSASASTLPINGSTQITAFVLEAGGTAPQNGTVVTFLTTLGRVEPSQVKTNGGRAETTFYSGTASGTAIITAASGGAKPADSSSSGSGTANQVSIKIGAAAVSQVAVSASPTTVPASGGTSTISASVTDENGNALGGVPVTFSTDAGSLSQSTVTTDATGRAQTTLMTSQTSKVTAKAGAAGASGAPSADVTVNVNTTPTITVGSPSPSSPVEDSAVTFTLTRGSGGSPVQQTLVSWGDGQSQTYSGLPSSISHIYREPGGYGVLVSATDAYGDVSTGSQSVTVSAKPAPTISALSASPSPTVNTPVTFSATIAPPTGFTITSTTWTYGDGNSDSLQGAAGSVQHTYTTANTYTVTVTATASNGESTSASMVITVGT